jgi:IS4 transposase
MRPVTIIGSVPETLKQIRVGLRSGTLNAVREVLCDPLIEQVCRETGLLFRKRVLTPAVTVLHMVLAALWPEESFAASWQVMWDAQVSRQPDVAGKSPNSGSLSKARGRLTRELWDRLFERIAGRCAALGEDFDTWRTHRVVLLDGTCVSMSDEDELMDAFGTNDGCHGRGTFPLARLVTAAALCTRTVLSYAMGRYDRSENALSWPALETLRKGDLVVGDRRFAGAALYAGYRAMGLEFLTRMHQCVQVSKLKRLVEFGPDDFVTEMTVWPHYRRKDPTLPETVTVRIIRSTATIRGKKTTLWLVTSLLDAERYPAEEIKSLYGMRWRIETLFDELKGTLSADVLRSKTVEGVIKEMAARMLTLNVVRTVMVEAALRAKAKVERISFVHAVRAVVVFSCEMATAAAWKLPLIYEAMLTEIASHRIPHRPGRNEPRAVRRETKHYPTLRTTRRLWRLTQVA